MKYIAIIFALILHALPCLSQEQGQCDGLLDTEIKLIIVDSSEEQLKVADWRLTSKVDEKCPVDILTTTVPFGKKVYLWTRIAGNKKALDWLIAEQRLPLRHIWHTKDIGAWKVKNIITLKNTVVDELIKKALLEEYNNRGFWDWRTSSNKENLVKGLWRVTIVDKKGKDVTCADGKECEILFEVK